MRYKVDLEFHKDYVRVDGEFITVGLSSLPEKGKANRELIRKLAKRFDTSPSNVKIVSGFKSRRKVVEIKL